MGGENVVPCEMCAVQYFDTNLIPVFLTVDGKLSRTRFICNSCLKLIKDNLRLNETDGLKLAVNEENEKIEDIEARLDNLEYTLDKLHTVLKQIGDALIDMRESGDFNAYILKEGLRSL